jgi:3-deoxy-D-manno-octulosonic-acid transferase
LAAVPLIEHLLNEYPAYRLAVTTTTPTGSERVTALFGERVYHCYAPYDLPGAVRRFLDKVKPELLVIMETELWPDILQASAATGVPIILANARLSARSARGYLRFAALTRQMLGRLDCVAAQTAEDGQRFMELGLPGERLHVTGSIKWDIETPVAQREMAARVASSWHGHERPVLIAASTHPGEEAMLLEVMAGLRSRFPKLLLVLVPRHPERFDGVVTLARAKNHQVQRRSEGEVLEPGTEVVVADTMGELMTLMGAATLAFVGGSLVPHGGHNVLEPAAWGVPILVGPHTFNFQRVTELLRDAKALEVVADTDELTMAIADILGDEERQGQMRRSCLQVVENNRGALGRLQALVAAKLEG